MPAIKATQKKTGSVTQHPTPQADRLLRPRLQRLVHHHRPAWWRLVLLPAHRRQADPATAGRLAGYGYQGGP